SAALLRRSGEGALLVTEQLALDQLRRNRRAVELHERPVGASAVLVDRARDELLAGAVLPGDEHAARARRGLRDLVEDEPHRAALAHHREVALRAAAQALVLVAEACERERVLDGDQQLLAGQRLLVEVVRATLGRLYRGLD